MIDGLRKLLGRRTTQQMAQDEGIQEELAAARASHDAAIAKTDRVVAQSAKVDDEFRRFMEAVPRAPRGTARATSRRRIGA